MRMLTLPVRVNEGVGLRHNALDGTPMVEPDLSYSPLEKHIWRGLREDRTDPPINTPSFPSCKGQGGPNHFWEPSLPNLDTPVLRTTGSWP